MPVFCVIMAHFFRYLLLLTAVGSETNQEEMIMSMNAEQRAQVVKEYQLSPNDTGSVEVQVALLTSKIQYLTEHFKIHKHDNHSRQGLLRHVSQRRKLLDYLKSRNVQRYQDLIKRLGLRR